MSVLELPMEGPTVGGAAAADDDFDNIDDGGDGGDGAGAGDDDDGASTSVNEGATWDEEQGMQKVKEYVALTREIQTASKLMSELRKQQKHQRAQIDAWMVQNSIAAVATSIGRLMRQQRERKVTMKPAYVATQLRELGKMDEKTAKSVAKSLWANRPATTVSVLDFEKKAKGKGTKRARSEE
jgi:hypothetical protein